MSCSWMLFVHSGGGSLSVVAPDLTPLGEIVRRVQARAKEIQDGPNAGW